MLIHPWDAALAPAEWQQWVADSGRFGLLTVSNREPEQAPLALPVHFTVVGDELLIHLARPNPAWPHLEAASQVRLVVIGDYAYIPTCWRAEQPGEDGVPTSYYASVQFVCQPTVVDDPHDKAAILSAQLADFEPEGGHAPVAADTGPYARLLPGIRGVRLRVLAVEAKFKYDDAKPVAHRERVSGRLEQRGQRLDAAAARQQRRRLAAIGEWQSFLSRR